MTVSDAEFRDGWLFLRDDLLDHMPMHVGQAAVDAIVADSRAHDHPRAFAGLGCSEK